MRELQAHCLLTEGSLICELAPAGFGLGELVGAGAAFVALRQSSGRAAAWRQSSCPRDGWLLLEWFGGGGEAV